MQQLNAVTNLGTMLLAGLGGALVPVMELPKWVQPVAVVSPVNWAMEGYRDTILDGGGVGDVVLSLAAMAGLAVVLDGVRALAPAPRRAEADVGMSANALPWLIMAGALAGAVTSLGLRRARRRDRDRDRGEE